MRPSGSPLRRCAALWLLALQVWALGWTGPLMAVGVASFDDDHAVRLGRSGDGTTSVVLAHDAGTPGRAPGHRHCVVASTLVAFTAAPAGSHPDHVLEFAPGTSFARAAERAGPAEVPTAPRACVGLRVAPWPVRESPPACGRRAGVCSASASVRPTDVLRI